MRIESNVLDRQFFMYQQEYERKALDVLRSGWYVLGKEVTAFEQEFADYLGVKHCVGLASGLDALWISMRLLGIHAGDEVIVQGNAYIACVMGITINGATPVFVEPDVYNNIDADKIEAKITKRTKAILVVHLYGQASNMGRIEAIAGRYGLLVVEDCAQAHGAKFAGHSVGTFGKAGCYSFYPSKNLGAFGDGGALVTNDDALAAAARIFRNYGSEKRYHNRVVGANSRLDELQAGLLRVKLSHLDELIEERAAIAAFYLANIQNPYIELPRICAGATHVWHLFVIHTKRRAVLIEYLKKHDISCLVHYPIPPYCSEAYQYLGIEAGSLPVTDRFAQEVLTLPLYNGMTEQEMQYVVDAINGFGGDADEA